MYWILLEQNKYTIKMSNKINNAKNGSSPSKNGAINNHDEPYESPYLRQPKKFNFWRGIYNKDKNYILGRTPRNWGQYIINFLSLSTHKYIFMY